MNFKFEIGDLIYFLRQYNKNLPDDEACLIGIIINRCDKGYWVLWTALNEIDLIYDSKIIVEKWYEKII